MELAWIASIITAAVLGAGFGIVSAVEAFAGTRRLTHSAHTCAPAMFVQHRASPPARCFRCTRPFGVRGGAYGLVVSAYVLCLRARRQSSEHRIPPSCRHPAELVTVCAALSW